MDVNKVKENEYIENNSFRKGKFVYINLTHNILSNKYNIKILIEEGIIKNIKATNLDFKDVRIEVKISTCKNISLPKV